MTVHPLVAAGTVLASGLALHAAANGRHLRRPDAGVPPVTERVSVLVPARDEQDHVGTTVADLLAQTGVPELEVLVLDDGSTDGTAAVLARFDDPRLTVLTAPDDAPPAGWLGKSWACARLAERATGSVLVFADADVRFTPDAVRACVAALRTDGFGLVSPFPREVAEDWMSRLVQPLLAWSVVATLPLGLARRSTRPALSAANGQFVVVDAATYRRAGGHAAVAGDVLEDIGLMRAVKSAGARAATLDGSRLAACRMYRTPAEVVDGYGKSLWTAFGGPGGSLAVAGALVLGHVVPPVAALAGRRPGTRIVGLLGYAAAVAGRAAVARRVGGRVWPDSAAHPASVLAFAGLTAESWRRHLAGTASWKGRALTAPTPAAAIAPTTDRGA
jgi:hypothetical protein